MGNRMLILWLAAGAGVVLLYAAYKGKSPTSVVTSTLSQTGKSATGKTSGTPAPATVAAPGAVGTSFTSGGTENIDGTYWVVDTYGNPVSLLPTAYRTSPNTYTPPNLV